MEKRALYQITNISKLNQLPKNSNFNDCLQCLLNQDFKSNKYITPDTLSLLKTNYKDFKLVFKNDKFFVNGKDYHISYQLKCEYYIIKCLQKYIQNDILYNYFFEKDDKYGNISKNIRVEVNKPAVLEGDNRYRVDLEFTLENGYKIIIEINENQHEDEGKRYKDLSRARQIIDNYKILKFYMIREKFVKNNYKNIRDFVKNQLIPFIKEASELHDEKKYIVNKLVSLTVEEWRPICELTYESHLNKNKPVINVDLLHELHDFKWTDNFIKTIKELVSCSDNNSEQESDLGIDLSDLDLSDVEFDEESDKSQLTNNNESIKDYYNINDNEIKLTWKGFNAYHTYIVRYIPSIKKSKKIFEFHHKIHTEFLNVLKDHRNQMLKLYQSNKVWGYNDKDYDYIKKNIKIIIKKK